MNNWITCAVVGILAVVGQAVPQNPPAGTGLILGRVIDGSTDKAVAGAIVTLSSAPPSRVVTDSGGAFVFRNLPAGSYRFTVTGSSAQIGGLGVRRPGGPAQTLELAEAERVGDVVIRVWKYGSVSGTVLDQYGDPVVETKVAVMRADIVAGRRRYVPIANQAITDDRGMYRISRLAPGDYIACIPFTQVTIPLSVQADSRQAQSGGQNAGMDYDRMLFSSGAPSLYATGSRVGDLMLVRTATAYASFGPVGPNFSSPSPAADGRIPVYPWQFYPGVTRLADASVFTLESGIDRAGTDFHVKLVSSVRISGRVRGPDGPMPAIAVHLIPQGATDVSDDSAIEAASTITERDGRFTMLGVPAGQYVIKVARAPLPGRPPMSTSVATMGPNGGVVSFTSAPDTALPPPLPTDPTLGGTLPVAVGDTDLTNLEIALQPGARVTGRLEYDGTRAPLTPEQVQRLTLTFEPADGRSGVAATGRGQFDANGQFSSIGLLPGAYLVRLGPVGGGWELKSAIVSNRDVADLPLVVDSTDIGNVVIRLTDHPSRLVGSVRDGSGNVDRNASVVVFPVERDRWTNVGTTLRIRLMRVTTKGTYEIFNLAAGDYFVAAIDDQAAAGWQDPRTLDALARVATRVTIGDGERKGQDLVTARIR